jgi:hypothetical protein
MQNFKLVFFLQTQFRFDILCQAFNQHLSYYFVLSIL